MENQKNFIFIWSILSQFNLYITKTRWVPSVRIAKRWQIKISDNTRLDKKTGIVAEDSKLLLAGAAWKNNAAKQDPINNIKILYIQVSGKLWVKHITNNVKSNFLKIRNTAKIITLQIHSSVGARYTSTIIPPIQQKLGNDVYSMNWNLNAS